MGTPTLSLIGAKKLFEFNNIFDTGYSTCAVNRAYGIVSNSNGSSKRAPARNQPVAIVRELLSGDIASLQLSAKDAGNAVSTIQIFSEAIETITERLAKILELAQKALELYRLQGQAEQMQQQFRGLAEEINQIAGNTKYKSNRLFYGSGKTLSIPAGNGSKIDIIAKDFRLDAQGLNIATEPESALSTIKKAIKNISEYKTDLDGKAAHLVDITTAIESEIQNALDVNVQDFQPERTTTMVNFTAGLISQNEQTSLDTQANLAANEILKLLKTGS